MQNDHLPDAAPDERKRRRSRARKRGKRSRQAVVGTGIAALLLLGGFGLGKGWGWPTASNGAAPAVAIESDAVERADASASPTQASEKGIVEVREDRIFYLGQPIAIDALRESILRDYEAGAIWALRDAHAKKARYDEARALMTELAINFIEIEAAVSESE